MGPLQLHPQKHEVQYQRQVSPAIESVVLRPVLMSHLRHTSCVPLLKSPFHHPEPAFSFANRR